MIHLLLAPGTKVEESFNVQATHDLIYENYNISNYDHNDFPGVVPRTFVGPFALASFGFPLRIVFWLFGIQKIWMLFAVRFFLGAAVVISFCNFCRCIRKHFGEETAIFLRVITASQFHLLFYASRPLPNVFALFGVLFVLQKWFDGQHQSAVRWATAVTFLFRCELVLLFAPVFLPSILARRLPLFGRNGAIFAGVTTALKVLAISVPLDSLLWGRWIWPEGEVGWFNIVLNRSHEYGVSPFLWYFYSAIPRVMLASLVLVPLGLLIDRRLPPLVIPPLIFVLLYSILPHKELRFILYVFPLLNLPAAVFCARMWISRHKNFIRWLLAYGFAAHLIVNAVVTCLFLYASARNYPGNDAIVYLQHMMRMDGTKHKTLHLDVMTCQTGVSRFHHLYTTWEYNKTEELDQNELERFDFLSVGANDGKLRELISANYSSTHRVLFVVPSFDGIKWRKFRPIKWSPFPFYYPELKFTEKVGVLTKKMMCGRALRAIWKFLIGPFWRPFMGTLQVALAAFLIINRSFLCSFEPRFPAPNPCNFTNLKANLEITHEIPLNELGEFHQSVHFSLSIYIAFHAEYREVVHIMKHIDQSHNIALSGENFLENLTVFFYALNFEFHVLLASYAYLLFRQNSLTSTSAKDLSAASTIAEVQVDRAAISTTIDTSNTEHVKPPLPPPPTFQEQLTLIKERCWQAFQVLCQKTDKHECKVLVFATVGLTLYNFCGIFVALQTITQYDEIKSKRTLTECWIALVVPVISCFETTFQTILMTRCNLHHIAMYLLFVLNGLAVINNMMEMLEAGIHSTLVTRIVNRNFLIFARALSSFGLFYRLASFFRFGHFIKNFTSEKPHVASESEGLLNPEHQQHQDD
ncbi:unnamed protein product, partial [Mesorhabditis belari]|uniref:Mannosyltransferase n=1 Tax=Mesorhabditis belari TaxID=2138241 RepID=A0AAF3F1C3_9BILA